MTNSTSPAIFGSAYCAGTEIGLGGHLKMVGDWGLAVWTWLIAYKFQLAITLAMVVFYFASERFFAPKLAETVDNARFRTGTTTKALSVARAIAGTFGILVLLFVWGVDLGNVLVFATTAITLLGVALFANWSLLSNVTSYFVLLAHPSFRRGDFIRVIDVDNYTEGYISELNLFNTKLITENREVVLYPNNLLLSRPMLVNPKDRLSGMGKVGVPAGVKSDSAMP